MNNFLLNNSFENVDDLMDFFYNGNPYKKEELKIEQGKKCCGVMIHQDDANSIQVCKK